MTTVTHKTTDYEVRPIAAEVLAELRARDDAGNPAVRLIDADGGAPLRCCLRPVLPGERVALVSYAPLRRWARETGAEPGPYDEVGPVFIHDEACGGSATAGYPQVALVHARALEFGCFTFEVRRLG